MFRNIRSTDKRIHVAALASALTLAFAANAHAETWRMAFKFPLDSVEGEAHQLFAERVEELTEGDLIVKLFPNEQLGNTDAVLEQLGAGTIDIYAEAVTFLQAWVPEIQWTGAPFLFSDREHFVRFMGSDLVDGWFAEIEEVAGIKVLGTSAEFIRGPWAVMASTRPWRTLEEMQGIKLRMHSDELNVEAWSHLGAEVLVLPWTEVYQAIAQGIVEAVNVEIAILEPMNFYEVAPYIIRHDYKPAGLAYMVSAESWSSLDAEAQAAVMEAYRQAATLNVELNKEQAEATTNHLEAEGVTFINDVERDAFVERMGEFYTEKDRQGDLPDGFLKTVTETR